MENYEIAVKFLIDEVERLCGEIGKQYFYKGVAQERKEKAKDEIEIEAWKALEIRCVDSIVGNKTCLLNTISKFCKDWRLEGSRLERGNNGE